MSPEVLELLRLVILGELVVTVLATLAFIGVFGDPRDKDDPVISWHLWSFAVLAAAADVSLLALAFGLLSTALTMVVFTFAYAGQAGVAIWRLVLVIQGRRARSGSQSMHGGG